MDVTFIPSSARSGAPSYGELSFGGHLYRFQKELTDAKYRRKCARSERNFTSPGYAVADGAAHGSTVLRNGERATHCEPRATAAEVATIRGDVIAKEGAFGGVTPLRAVALSLANASTGATHTLPPSLDPSSGHPRTPPTGSARRRRSMARRDPFQITAL